VLARRGVGDAVPTRRKSGRSVWATAPRGHARAPPANAMNSRRLIVTPNATRNYRIGSNERLEGGRNVRFAIESRHVQCTSSCRLWAKSGHAPTAPEKHL